MIQGYNTATQAGDLVARGMQLHQGADADGALQCYARALELDPSAVQAHYLSALIATQREAFTLAEHHLQAACALAPDHAPAALLRGHVLNRLDDACGALASLDRALALMPAQALAWTYRAQALLALHRHEDALAASDEALRLNAHSLTAHAVRGETLIAMGRHDEALDAYSQVLRIDPLCAQAHYNRAQALVRLDEIRRDEEFLVRAEHEMVKGLALNPDNADAHRLHGAMLHQLGRLDEAIASLQEAIRLDPANRDAHYGLAECWIVAGDWVRGWEKFDNYRKRPAPDPDAQQAWSSAVTGATEWTGESLAGKSILVVADGGLGDTLNFHRYVPLMSAMGAARVSVSVQAPLQTLLNHHRDEDASAAAPQAPHDYYVRMMSLPRAFGTLTGTVPPVGDSIRADAVKAARWRERLQDLHGSGRKLRVGLAWSGNPAHLNDHNRSLPLSQLSGLLDEPDIAWCSLQQVVRDTDQDALSKLPQLAFFGGELQDFDDTAALCEAMDLIITVDTSIAHLAGVLGKPVWIMLPAMPDYRWLLHGQDTPWYPTARLFRQNRRNDWKPVVARVHAELQSLLAAHGPTASDLIAQGMALQQATDANGAAACYARAIELDPSNVQAHFLNALVAVQQSRLEEARGSLDTACALDPDHAQAAMLRGHVLDRLRDYPGALASLDHAATLMPESALLWNYHAQTLFSLQRYAEALASCDRTLTLAPSRSDALFLRVVLLQMLNRFDEAVQASDQLVAARFGDAVAHELVARGFLAGLGRGQPESRLLRLAHSHLDMAIALQPDSATAHEAQGCVWERKGDPQEALASYRQALALRPDWDDAAYAVGRCLLALGDWENGWAAHERRWFRPNAMAWRRQTGAPLWHGEPLAGKSIAIVAERGFGDVIQFFRFVEPVRALAASVSVVLPPALHRLLGPAVDLGRTPHHQFDYHCPLLSLAHRLGITASNMPGTGGYLKGDPALHAAWRQRLGTEPRLRVGLVWRGDPAHGNDHNRSLSLAQLAPLFDVNGVDFICLQQVMRDADRQAHAGLTQLRFYGHELHDFADTAALCDAMDLVISVDTSVGHLAGALNKPLWLLLPAVADWRWMQDREDSPWYARARLFRQSQQGDWDGVIRRVRDALIDAAAAPAR